MAPARLHRIVVAQTRRFLSQTIPGPIWINGSTQNPLEAIPGRRRMRDLRTAVRSVRSRLSPRRPAGYSIRKPKRTGTPVIPASPKKRKPFPLYLDMRRKAMVFRKSVSGRCALKTAGSITWQQQRDLSCCRHLPERRSAMLIFGLEQKDNLCNVWSGCSRGRGRDRIAFCVCAP